MPLCHQPSARYESSGSSVPQKPSVNSSQPGARLRQPNSQSASRAGSQSGSTIHPTAVDGYGSNRDEENLNQQDTASEDDDQEECTKNRSSESGSGKSKRRQQQQAEQHPANTSSRGRPEPLLIGTPGPGTYTIPSCFMSPDRPMNSSAYVLATNVGTTIKCRNFPPGTGPLSGGCSPGPLAYAPVLEAASCKPTASRTVFGSAGRAQLPYCTHVTKGPWVDGKKEHAYHGYCSTAIPCGAKARIIASKLYLGSAELSKAAAIPTGGPGPGTYRVGCGRSPGRAAPGPPTAPRATFASAHSTPNSTCRPRPLSSQSLDELTPQQHAYILGFHSNCTTPGRDVNVSARPATSSPPVLLDASATWGSGNSSSVNSSVDARSSSGNKVASTAGPGGRQNGTACSTEQGMLGKTGNAWTFGPPSLAEGMRRRRSKEGNVFISKQHAQVDPGELVAASIPGPSYDVDGKLQLLSTHRNDGTSGFGKEKKAAAFTAKVYVSSEHVKSDPTLSDSPGPGTAAVSLPGSLASPLRGSTVGPRFGSPSRSLTSKAPYISDQHQAELKGRDSPGPACYNAAAAALAGSALGDRRTAHFGTGEREVSSKVKRTFAPGPGAYQGELTKLSTHITPPSFSLGGLGMKSSLLGPSTGSALTSPGVGSYTIALADRQCLPSAGAPSIKGALEHGGITAKSYSPGPAAYSPRGFAIGEDAIDTQQQKWGFMNSSGGSRQQPGSLGMQKQVSGGSGAVEQQQQQQKQHDMQQKYPGARLSGQLHGHFLKNARMGHLHAGAAHSSSSSTTERSSTAPACASSGLDGELNSTNASTPQADCASMALHSSDAATWDEEATSATANAGDVGQDICSTGRAGAAKLPSRACSPRKGFSMYGKFPTPEGVVSPGPAAYAVDERAVTPCAGSCKLRQKFTREVVHLKVA